ncbi:twitching motility protein PilT (plasmid) [Rickettsiales bacterium Ac37b]|nr:twitching motility protein PilT [Rickettsiales bacterium Ac37b]
MIGIDTNVLVRYLTQDDETQSQLANQLLEYHIAEKNYIFLNNIVLCELIWVLEKGYKYNRSIISSTVRHLLSIKEFRFENLDILWATLEDYEESKGDFSDLLIGIINVQIYDCDTTITFDKQAATSSLFQIIE